MQRRSHGAPARGSRGILFLSQRRPRSLTSPPPISPNAIPDPLLSNKSEASPTHIHSRSGSRADTTRSFDGRDYLEAGGVEYSMETVKQGSACVVLRSDTHAVRRQGHFNSAKAAASRTAGSSHLCLIRHGQDDLLVERMSTVHN